MKNKWIGVLLAISIPLAGCTQPQQLEAAAQISTAEQETPSQPNRDEPRTDTRSVEEDLQELLEMHKAMGKEHNHTYTPAEVSRLVDFMVDRGYTAVNLTGGNYYNHEHLLDFIEASSMGEESEAVMFSMAGRGIERLVHYKSGPGGITAEYHSYWDAVVPDQDIARMELREWGYVSVHSESGATQDSYRILPQPQEYADAYLAYVLPLRSNLHAGMITKDWDIRANTEELYWDFIFECISGESFDNKERDPDTDLIAFPAELYEGLLQRYFDVPTDTLRKDEYYDADTNAYLIGGNPFPYGLTAVEVWEIEENQDGSLTLTIVFLYPQVGPGANSDPGYTVNSYLTVMPEEDGGFKYISNRMAG